MHVVPADFSLRHLDLHLEGTSHPTERLAALLDPVRDHYDLALLDCPPSISLASESVFGAADTLLVPVVPATLAESDAHPARRLPRRPGGRSRRAATAVHGRPPPQAAPRAGRVARQGVARAARHRHPLGGDHRAHGPGAGAGGVYAPSGAATRAYRALWAEVAAALWPS